MTGNTININNKSERVTEINIEGTIGIPEEWQFESEDNRVATYEKFRVEMERIRQVSSPEVVVNIRSTGGNVNDALLIYDALAELKSKITTRCFGYTASAATIIAQAAGKGRREISENALYLIHKSVSASEGNSNNMSQTIELLEKTDQRIAAIYAARSSRLVEDFVELMECNSGNGKWLSPSEAMEAGLVDRVVPAVVSNDATQMGLTVSTASAASTASTASTVSTQRGANVRKYWNSILDIMGVIQGDAERVMGERKGDNKEVQSRSQASQTSKPEQTIEDLNDKIEALEGEAARMNAFRTTTEAVDDPSPTEVKITRNANSYQEDIRSFIK